jgi:hypothetical protein
VKFARLLGALTAHSALAWAGVISGTVVDATKNEPVRKAIVTLTWQGTPRSWATSQTDSSGEFRFEGLPPGTYELRAAKANAGTSIYGAFSAHELGELISLEDGETRAGVKLRFLRWATISGRVLNSDGDPASGVVVTLLVPGRDAGARVLNKYRRAETDDRGEYRVDGVAPGRYYLHASPPLPQMGRAPAEPLEPEFLGGVHESKDSAVLNIHGGENLIGNDFHMTAEPQTIISGHVTGIPDTSSLDPSAPRAPLRGFGGMNDGVEVFIEPADEYVAQVSGFGASLRPPDNSFTFQVSPGRYRLQAGFQAGGKTWMATRLIDTRQPTGDMVLALAPVPDIKGRLRIEGQYAAPQSGFEVRVKRTLGAGFLTIRTHVAADGTFTLPQVPPGEWELSVDAMLPAAFLKSARRLVVEPGLEKSLNVVVSMNSAHVRGEVDSKRAGILLAPVGANHDVADFYYNAQIDDNGNFAMDNIVPGKYRIYALEKLTAADFKTPEAVDQLDPLGAEIDLAEGASIEVHPELISPERARKALP